MPDNRQQRRAQAARGVSAAEHPHPDPMRPVYIGFGILILLVFLIFGGYRFKQTQDIKAAYATPTPGPNASSKPIKLADGGTVGKPALASFDEKSGGTGQPIDDIKCEASEQVTLHVHSHLALFVKGKQVQVPPFIGMVPNAQQSVTCLYWVHIHDGSGIIHVEAPEIRNYSLANFFHIWGMDLNANQVGPFSGPVTAFVNGAKYDGDLGAIPLSAHQQITLEVGTPVVPPPNYTFPPGD